MAGPIETQMTPFGTHQDDQVLTRIADQNVGAAGARPGGGQRSVMTLAVIKAAASEAR